MAHRATRDGDRPQAARAAPHGGTDPARPRRSHPRPVLARSRRSGATGPWTDAAPARKIFWTEELLHTEIKHYNSAYEGGAQFQIDNGKVIAVVLTNVEAVKPNLISKFPLLNNVANYLPCGFRFAVIVMGHVTKGVQPKLDAI